VAKEHPEWVIFLMISVHVICESQTDEIFVKEILLPELLPKYLFKSDVEKQGGP